MKMRVSFTRGMYNWALTPLLSVWRNRDGGFGIGLHFLRLYVAAYSTRKEAK
jgi:hypothetical protein